MKIFIHNLCILIIFEIVLAQVNTNLTQLQKDFRKRASIIGVTSEWYKYSKMNNYGRFLLCVDVLQKIEKTRLIGGQYITEKPNLKIPDFQYKFMNLGNASVSLCVLHCPLHTVTFEKLSYKTGPEFYIIDSLKTICVYMMKLNETSQKLLIVAEVCGIMVNMRYNREELDAEIKATLQSSSKDFILLDWPELASMNDENKLAMCMEFYERISYHKFCTSNKTIPPVLPSEESSLFKINKYFHLVFSDRKIWKGYVDTLLCPMNRLYYSAAYSSRHIGLSSPPFQLAKSINNDCIYGVQIINTTDQYHTHKEHETGVSIQAELCGIFGPKTFDVPNIENDLVRKWKSVKNYSVTTYPPSEFSILKSVHLFQLCVNVYRKLFYKRKTTLTTNYTMTFEDLILKINSNETLNIQINTFKCPPFPHTWRATVGQIKNVYLLNSLNLDCVYVLTNTLEDYRVLEIIAEICDVHPSIKLLEVPCYFFQHHEYCSIDSGWPVLGLNL